jgi:hypothetical protein
MTRFPLPRVATTLLLLLASAACSSEDSITDQASGEIDKSPAGWSEPGAKADPPVVRDAGTSDAEPDAALARCTKLTLESAGGCSFTLPRPVDEGGLGLFFDGAALSGSAATDLQFAGSTVTLVGPPCDALTASLPGDGGTDGGADGGAHQVQVQYLPCMLGD